MTTNKLSFSIFLALLALLWGASGTRPQGSVEAQVALGTGFTFQSQLKLGGSPFTGICDFRFSLWDSLSSGSGQVGSAQTVTGVMVINGLFAVQLNTGNEFGANAFAGSARWLQTDLKCDGDIGFTALSPRQPVTPAPYALYASAAGSAVTANTALTATTAATAGSVPWGGLADMPGGFADGIDNNTTYSAAPGGGLVLNGSNQFSVVTSTVQARVTGSCAAGQYLQSVNANGTVNCAAPSGLLTVYVAPLPVENQVKASGDYTYTVNNLGVPPGSIAALVRVSCSLPATGDYCALHRTSGMQDYTISSTMVAPGLSADGFGPTPLDANNLLYLKVSAGASSGLVLVQLWGYVK